MRKLIKISPKVLLVPLFLASGCANDLHGNYRKNTYFSALGTFLTEPPFKINEACQFNDLALDKNRLVDKIGKFWATKFLSCSEMLQGTEYIFYNYGLIKEIEKISAKIKSLQKLEKENVNTCKEEDIEEDIKECIMKKQNEMDDLLNRYFPVVSVSSLPKENSKEDGKTVTNLSDHGQESLIHELANLSKTGGKSSNGDAAKNLIKALSTEFKPEEQKGPVNHTVFNRWLYVTVKEPKILAPADKIVKTIVTITLQNPTNDQNESKYIPARFVYWDKAVTAYETIEQGEIKTELTNKAELTAKVSPPTTAPVDGSLEGTLSRQFTRSETLPVKQGSEQLTVNIECSMPQFDSVSDTNKSSIAARNEFQKSSKKDCDNNGVLNTLSVYKRSVTGGQPLTGTTQVGVKIKLGNFPDEINTELHNISAISVDGLDKYRCKSRSDACLKERQDKLSFQDITLVNPNFTKKPLKANLDINFVIRHVKSGWDTYEEGDDDIELIQFNDQRNMINPIILLPSEIPQYYGIYTNSTPSMPLVAKYDGAPNYDVNFICYESRVEANKFIDFYKSNITSQNQSYDLVRGRGLYSYFGGTPRSPYSARGIVVKPGCGKDFKQDDENRAQIRETPKFKKVTKHHSLHWTQ